MLKKGVMVLSLLFLVISVVSAVETDIEVKTLGDNRVTIRVLNIETMDTLGEFTEEAEKGEIFITYSGDEEFIMVSTFIKGNPLKIFRKDSLGNNISTGGEIYIDLTSGEPKALVTEKVVEPLIEEPEPVVVDEPEEATGGESVTGLVVGDGWFSGRSWIYGIIGLVVIVGGILFFVMKRKFESKIRPDRGSVSSVKLSELSGQGREKLREAEEDLKEAKERLEKASKKIDDIKNKDGKVAEAKRRFEEAKKELEGFGEGAE